MRLLPRISSLGCALWHKLCAVFSFCHASGSSRLTSPSPILQDELDCCEHNCSALRLAHGLHLGWIQAWFHVGAVGERGAKMLRICQEKVKDTSNPMPNRGCAVRSRETREVLHLSGVNLLRLIVILSSPGRAVYRWNHWIMPLVCSRGSIWIEIWLTLKRTRVCVLPVAWIFGVATDKRSRWFFLFVCLFFNRLESKMRSVTLRFLWLNAIFYSYT